MLRDLFGRSIDYLRLSVTDRSAAGPMSRVGG
jgi:molybdenum cofactor biosynthesis enzyme MoaA